MLWGGNKAHSFISDYRWTMYSNKKHRDEETEWQDQQICKKRSITNNEVTIKNFNVFESLFHSQDRDYATSWQSGEGQDIF